jgi:hypothetical protein
MRLASVAALALLAFASIARAAPDPRYVQGKAEWLERHYPPATALLYDLRTKAAVRTVQIDYMIGTGACRTPGRRSWGLGFLDWALYRYSLAPGARSLVQRERDLCRGTSPLPTLDATVATAALQTAAGSWAQGKIYYLRNADEPVATYTARPLGTLDPQALARRLVPVNDPAAIQAALAPTLPASARLHVVSRYAFVTTAGQSDAQLDAMAAQLDVYLAFLDRTYGIRLPPNYLTIYLVPTQEDMRATARRLHMLDISPATIGYTFQDDQSAVALIPGDAIGTLFHELFHLVVRSTFGDIPQWLDEGVAALYEVSEIDRGTVRGLRNWRGPVLLDLWSQRPLLRDVITADWFVSDTPSEKFEYDGPPPSTQAITVQFAVARYFALYLQKKGKLQQLFAKVQSLTPHEGVNPAQATLAAAVSVIGPIDTVQADFDRWFLATERSSVPDGSQTATQTRKYEPGNAPPPVSKTPQDCAPNAMSPVQQQQQALPPGC